MGQKVRAAKRVVMYLLNTKTLGITYRRGASAPNVPLVYEVAQNPLDNEKNLLPAFADSDYAADETRRSTMGSVIMMNSGLVSWCSVLGKTIATSTFEAEANAACLPSKDAVHISRLLKDFRYSLAATPSPLCGLASWPLLGACSMYPGE